MKDGQKSKHSRVNLTSDRIDRLQQIGFDFNPRKIGRPSISGSSNTSCSSSKRQRVEERVESLNKGIEVERSGVKPERHESQTTVSNTQNQRRFGATRKNLQDITNMTDERIIEK